jgi:hypothetical protein
MKPNLTLLALLALTSTVRADSQCHLVRLTFEPTDALQIVGWVEQADGTFVDTIYLTQKIGRYGMGNRPGRFDFNSGPPVHDMWPYGKRITTFPVWAHRHGKTFPEIVFRNADESNLSHPLQDSSPEHTPPYCRPMKQGSPNTGGDGSDYDTGTCATGMVGTDKGHFDPGGATSLYPPRADIARQCDSNVYCDDPSVDMYQSLNPFDAVTQATPAAGTPVTVTWTIPSTLPAGDYVVFVEVAKGFDFNGTFNSTSFPPPSNIPYGDYGAPYRGQPSVVYKVPITISTTDTAGATGSYAGFSDATGASGTLNPPDATMITEGTPASGAQRLELISGTQDRVEVNVHSELDTVPPAAPDALQPIAVTATSVTVQFVAPGDDGHLGKATGYDIRYRTVDPLTAANFDDPKSTPYLLSVQPVDPGMTQSVELDGLLPETDYWIGVRAYDDCHNNGDVAVVHVTTEARRGGYVDACFVATAAYGSKMAGDVELLRRFRDTLLRGSVLGELAVETYYTFGPPVAGVVGESDLLRALARDFLAPIIARVGRLAF